MREGISLAISLTLVILASFIAGFLFRPLIFDAFDFYTSKIEINQCENLTLEDAVYCLRDYINGFYRYVPRNDTFSSLEDLKENGGDCSDYSLLYKNLAESLGLKAKIINIYPDEGVGHAFAIIWDKNLTGYCKTEVSSNRSSVRCYEVG